MNKRGHIKSCNSSLTQSLRELEKSTLDGLQFYLRADFPTQPTSQGVAADSLYNLAQDTIIANALKKFALCNKNAESSLDSAESQNLIKKSCHSKTFYCHSERSEESQKSNLVILSDSEESKKSPFVILSEAKYLNNRDSSFRTSCFTQNDKLDLDSSLRTSCFTQNDKLKLDSVDFIISTQEANSSIVDEFLHLCEASDADRTNGSSRKRALRKCEKSPQDEFAQILV